MQTRPLGRTGLQLPILSFGASSLGQEFRAVSLDEALRSVHVALEGGLNFIDTSPFLRPRHERGDARPRAPRSAARQLHSLHQARPLRSPALRFLREARGRKRGCQPASARHRSPRYLPLPRHRVRGDGADRGGDAPRAAQGAAAGKGEVHRHLRLPDEGLPLRARADGGRLRPLLQSVHAAKYALRRRATPDC